MIFLSVVLPTYNRLARLKQVLAAFVEQTFAMDAFEVIVVADGATDGTNEFLCSLETPYQLTPILQSNQGPAAARNAGIAAATGDYILFIDDDVVPDPNLIQEHMRWHQTHASPLVVLGPMLTPEDYKLEPWVAWEQEMLYKQYDEMEKGSWEPTERQFFTGNTSLARKYILQAGGFDTSFRRAEDVELAYRLKAFNLKYVFAARAVGYHYANRSYQSWMTTPYAYGRNDVIFTRQKGQTWLLPTIYREYRCRHPFIQILVRYLLDRRRLSNFILKILRIGGLIGATFPYRRLQYMVYSAIFNLRYYQGVADELGGRAKFFTLADS